jgi:hypothetical protein
MIIEQSTTKTKKINRNSDGTIANLSSEQTDGEELLSTSVPRMFINVFF